MAGMNFGVQDLKEENQISNGKKVNAHIIKAPMCGDSYFGLSTARKLLLFNSHGII